MNELGLDINSEEGKKVFARVESQSLFFDIYEVLGIIETPINGKEIKVLLEAHNLEANFDNISNIMEILYGATLRNDEELEATKVERDELLTRIQASSLMTDLFSEVSMWNEQYTDSMGLFGMGAEGLSFIANKLGLDGENHYQWAKSCKKFAENAANLAVFDPAKFEEQFKKIYDESGKYGIEFNKEAFDELIQLQKEEKAIDADGKLTDEYKNAILKAFNFVIDNPNENLQNTILNGLGETVLMLTGLGWFGKTKTGATLAASTMNTFSRAGVAIASKSAKNKFTQGALRLAGNGVKLVGPALNEGTRLALYSGVTGTLANATNSIAKSEGNGSGLERFLATEEMIIGEGMKGSFMFGAFAGVFGSTVTQKVVQAVSKTSSKVTTALADKFAKGAVDANEVFATIMEKSVPTTIAEVAAFAVDVVGFTAFETALALYHGLNCPEEEKPEKFTELLWEEFKGQGYNLGQIKIVSHLITWLSGSRNARLASSKYLKQNIPQLKGSTVESLKEGRFKINLADGRRVECKNGTEMISALHLMVRGETPLSGKFPKPKTEKEVIKEICDKYKDVNDTELKARLIKAVAESNVEEVSELAIVFAERGNTLTVQNPEGVGTVKKANGEIKAEYSENPSGGTETFNTTPFRIEHKKGQGLFAKNEIYYNGQKLPSTPEELITLYQELGLGKELKPHEKKYIERRLQTKVDIQKFSILLIEAKEPNLFFFDLKPINTIEDAAIMGILKKVGYHILEAEEITSTLETIKENPSLYEVFLQTPFKNDNLTTIEFKKIFPLLKTKENCEIYLELIAGSQEELGGLRRFLDPEQFPKSIEEAQIINKATKVNVPDEFYNLPIEDRLLFNKLFNVELERNQYRVLIEGLLNSETHDSFANFILRNNTDIIATRIFDLRILDKTIVQRMEILDGLNVRYDSTYKDYLSKKIPQETFEKVKNAIIEIKEKYKLDTVSLKEATSYLKAADNKDFMGFLDTIYSNKNLRNSHVVRENIMNFYVEKPTEAQKSFFKFILSNEKLYNNLAFIEKLTQLKYAFDGSRKTSFTDNIMKLLQEYIQNPKYNESKCLTQNLGIFAEYANAKTFSTVIDLIVNSPVKNDSMSAKSFQLLLFFIEGGEELDFIKKLINNKNFLKLENRMDIFEKIVNSSGYNKLVEKALTKDDFPIEYLTSCFNYKSGLAIDMLYCENIDFDNIKVLNNIVKQVKEYPEKFINGEYKSPEEMQKAVDAFFKETYLSLLALVDIYDKEVVTTLLRQRFSGVYDTLGILEGFNNDELILLKNLSRACNVDGKPFLPKQKLDLIGIIEAYKLSGLSFKDMQQMITENRVDIGKLNLDLLTSVMKQCGFSNEEILLMSKEKLVSYNLQFIHLLAKNVIEFSNPALKNIIRAANSDISFKDYIHDTENIYGQINKRTKEIFKNLGIDYEKWVTPPKKLERIFHAEDRNTQRLSQIAARIQEDMNALMNTPVKGFLKKTMGKFIKGDEFVIPTEYSTSKAKLEELVKILCDTTEKGQLSQVWKRAKMNAEKTGTEMATKAMNTLTILDHLEQRLKDLSGIEKANKTDSIDITIRMWDRNPPKDLFQGDYSTCCIGMGGCNADAMPHYLLNTCFNMIELVDNTTGKIIGNALCYFVKGEDGRVKFVVDNIEINNSHIPSPEVGINLRNEIAEYVQSICKELTGNEKIEAYMSESYNDVPYENLPVKNENYSFIGDMDCDNIYLDLYDGWTDKNSLTQTLKARRLK